MAPTAPTAVISFYLRGPAVISRICLCKIEKCYCHISQLYGPMVIKTVIATMPADIKLQKQQCPKCDRPKVAAINANDP